VGGNIYRTHSHHPALDGKEQETCKLVIISVSTETAKDGEQIREEKSLE